MIRNRWEAYACGPIWQPERPAVFAYRFRSVCFHGRDCHPLIMGSGGENVVAWFMSALFSVGTIGPDVRHRFRGGALRALPDAG